MNHTVLWLACALAGLANPPAPEVPRVLVDVPLAARIAANDASHWERLGAAGFLFSGIYDDFLGAPQGGLQDLGPTAPESALLKELRLSVMDLREKGLSDNYLAVRFPPSQASFTDRARARQALTFFQGIGIFCQRAGLQGIALRVQADADVFRFVGTEQSSAQLVEAARDLGRRGMRAFIREIPDASLIFVVEGLDEAGPLWFPFFEGLVESVGAAGSIRMDLALDLPKDAETYDAVASHLETIEAQLCDALGTEARRLWQRQGGYAPVLEPLAVSTKDTGPVVEPTMTIESWRARIAMAKLVASDHVIVRGGVGTWWSLSASQARGYARLLQRPAGAAAMATSPRPETLNVWDFKTPFDRLARVGVFRTNSASPYVFVDGPRAACVFWSAPDAPLQTDVSASALLVSPLATPEPVTLSPEAGTVAAARVPVPALVAGLPLTPWAGPAALWCVFDATPTAGSGRVPLRLGVRNVFPGEIAGSIEVTTPDSLSLGVGELPILLKSGESAVFERYLQGRFSLGEPIRLSMTLRTPASPGVSRTVNATTHLATAWQQRRDGNVRIAPLLLPGESLMLVVASAAGDVAGYTPTGTLVWQRRYPPPLILSANAGYVEGSAPRFAVADATGKLRVLASDGALQWEATLETPIHSMVFADLFDTGRDCLLARAGEHSVTCLESDGHVAWRFAESAKALHLASAAVNRSLVPGQPPQPDEDRLFVATAGDSPELIRLGGNGATLWRRTLAANPITAPVCLPARGTRPARIAAALDSGGLSWFSADIGAPLESTPLPKALGEALACTVIEIDPQQDGRELAVRLLGGIALLNDAGGVLWTYEARGVQGLSRIDTPRFPTLLAWGRGELAGVSPMGGLLWRDRPPGSPQAVCAQGTDTLFVGAQGGLLQAIRIP